ncbi:MAG: T9SS type A sorting domain-containing protein [Bacteroidia bacterium]
MKKLLAYSIILISAFTIAKESKAQCSPDTTIKSSGIYPAVLNNAKEAIPYTQVIQFFINKDTLVTYLGQQILANIDSIKITGVKGMPTGFTYACHNATCAAKGGEPGCATITGTAASGSAGTYPLTVYYQVFARASFGGFPISQIISDSNKRYSINVESATGINKLAGPIGFELFPNPANEEANILVNNHEELSKVEIFTLDGKELELLVEYKTKNMAAVKTNSLPAGLYMVKVYSIDGRQAFKKLQIE